MLRNGHVHCLAATVADQIAADLEIGDLGPAALHGNDSFCRGAVSSVALRTHKGATLLLREMARHDGGMEGKQFRLLRMISLLAVCSGMFAWDARPASSQQPGSGFDVRVWTTDDGLPESDVVSVVSDPDGALLVGTRNCGIVRFNGSGFRQVAIDNSSPRVHNLVVGMRGDVYASMMSGVIAAYRDGRFTVEYRAPPGTSAPSWSLEQHVGMIGNADCFLTQAGGLVGRTAAPRGPVWRKIDPVAGLAAPPDGAGKTWRLDADGLWHIAGDGRETRVPIVPSVDVTTVECMHVDRENNVWLALLRRGLARVRLTPFRVATTVEGSPLPAAPYSLCQDRDGTIWLSSPGGGVWRMRGRQFEQVTQPAGAPAEESIVTARADGGVWVATQFAGLFRHEGDVREKVQEAGAFANVARAICEQGDTVWLGSEAGLFAAGDDGRRLDAIPVLVDGPAQQFFIEALAPDGAGGLWLGATRARLLHRGANGTWTLHEPDSPQRSQRHWALLPDIEIPGREAAGGVWIGTLGAGLTYFDGRDFHQVTTREGLPDDTVCQIVADKAGMFWLGTYRGIVRLKVKDAVAVMEGRMPRLECRRFGVADGMPVAQCSAGRQPACLRARDGSLWFSTDTGIAMVDPVAWPPAEPPPVSIQGLRLSNASAPWNPRLPLVLKAGQRALSFECEGLSLGQPEQVRYRWRLNGLGEAWVYGGASRLAEYERLPPGDYTFEVQAAVADGPWSPRSASVAFSIPPLLWERPWFRLGALVAALASSAVLGALAIRVRHRMQLKRLQREHAIERERSRIARDLHDDLGASLTHIDLLGAIAERSGLADRNVARHLQQIRSKAHETVAALDEIVWAVSPRNDTLGALADYISGFVQQFFDATEIRCRLDIAPLPADVPVAADVRHALFHAVKEAVNNVVRHSKAQLCHVRVAVRGRDLAIEVEDDGRGFDPHCEGFVAGDGLQNIGARMDGIGGTHVIESVPGRGTRVCLTVSLRNAGPGAAVVSSDKGEI